jgi:hypothetical protein
MNVLKYRVSLDMFDTLSQITIKAKKGDSACQIHITLTEKGKIYHIGEGCYATFNAKKSDGNFVYDKCTIENNTIVYDFSSSIDDNGICQVSAHEGIVECEVTLYNAEGKQLTSPRFVLFIDGTVYNGEKIISTPEANVLKELINETNNLIDDVETKLENGEFKGEKGENGKDAVTDQTYNPKSENAQSGKAVAEAVASITNGKAVIHIGTVLSAENEGVIVGKDFADECNVGDLYFNNETCELLLITKKNHNQLKDQYNIYFAHLYTTASATMQELLYGDEPLLLSLLENHNNSIVALEKSVGDIETALDSIIAIQEQLIGGESV